MWKPEHRVSAIDRVGLRYPSDMSDVEWALVGPMIPPARRGGRPRDVNVREVLNAVFYVLATGCQFCEDHLCSAEVNVGWCDVFDALMIANVIVVLDEGSNLLVEISG